MTEPRRIPRQGDDAPRLRDVADHIERRMAGKSGPVTLNYKDGKLERVQYGDFEDARAMPRAR